MKLSLIRAYDAKGTSTNPICSDQTTIYLKIRNATIKKAWFKTTGCFTATSAAKATCRLAKRKTLATAAKLTDAQITSSLSLDIPAKKLHCVTLARQALLLAIQDYQLTHDLASKSAPSCAHCPYAEICTKPKNTRAKK